MPVKVCLGGTFNVIHEGHLALLSRAFQEGDEVFVGLTSDRMAQKGRTGKVNDYPSRLIGLIDALENLADGKEFQVFKIDDEFGPAASSDFDVIVVSRETAPTAERINKARLDSGLRPLRIEAIDIVLGQDGKKVSASRLIDD